MDAPIRRAGEVRISFELLLEWLNLKDHEVVGIIRDNEDLMTRSFKVVVRGPKMPEVCEGCQAPIVEPKIEYAQKSKIVWDEDSNTTI